MVKKVIDLSKWNTVSDYDNVSKQIAGVIIRLGYRSLGPGIITIDPKFKNFITEFYNRGVPVGVYFFTTAITEAEAIEEANYTVNKIKSLGIELSFPIMIDTEYSNNDHTGRSDNLSKEQRTNCILAFCNQINKLGYEVGIYASDYWFIGNLESDRIKNIQKWNANYSSSPKYCTDNIVAWQKSSNERLDGLTDRVDVSDYYGEISRKSAKRNKSTKTLSEGMKIELNKVPIYSNSKTDISKSAKTGTYYIWSTKKYYDKVRITSSPDYIGDVTKVTGWVKVGDL